MLHRAIDARQADEPADPDRAGGAGDPDPMGARGHTPSHDHTGNHGRSGRRTAGDHPFPFAHSLA